MANTYPNKIIFGDETLIDLTSDTVDAAHLLSGRTVHDHTGAIITGECTYDADTKDANARADEILITKSAYVNGFKVDGAMPNRGAQSLEITDLEGETIPNGYHDGSGTASVKPSEAAKIIPGNIKDGISILGVLGTYTGEAIKAQTKSVTPYTTAQQILPDEGYDYLAEVNVAAISYVEVDNAFGGKTVTIGAVAPTP